MAFYLFQYVLLMKFDSFLYYITQYSPRSSCATKHSKTQMGRGAIGVPKTRHKSLFRYCLWRVIMIWRKCFIPFISIDLLTWYINQAWDYGFPFSLVSSTSSCVNKGSYVNNLSSWFQSIDDASIMARSACHANILPQLVLDWKSCSPVTLILMY